MLWCMLCSMLLRTYLALESVDIIIIIIIIVVQQAPAVSSKDSETVPANGLISDSADSMDVSRRQSVR